MDTIPLSLLRDASDRFDDNRHPLLEPLRLEVREGDTDSRFLLPERDLAFLSLLFLLPDRDLAFLSLSPFLERDLFESSPPLLLERGLLKSSPPFNLERSFPESSSASMLLERCLDPLFTIFLGETGDLRLY
jgi:hypothetical protein